MNIFYYLAPDVSKKTGEQRIRVAITVNKTRYISTVGMTIKADDWNQETQSAVAKSVNEKGIKGSAINDRLSTIRKHFRGYEDALNRVAQVINLYNNKRPYLSLNYKTPAQAYLETGEQVRVWKNYYKANKPEEVAHVIAELTSGCRTSATY